MTANAIVISVSGGRATVAVERSSACAGCASRAGCVGCAETVTAEAVNAVGAQTGDRVELFTPDSQVTALSFFAFFMPVALPILGYALAAYFINPTAGYIAAASLFLVSLSAVIALDHFYLRGKTTARIVRIIESGPALKSDG